VLATVLVQEGTFEVGDFLVVGENYGKVRAMTDSNGARITAAGPSTAVQVLGFSQTPTAGEIVARARDEHEAREIVAGRKDDRVTEADAAERRNRPGAMTLEQLLAAPEDKREVNIILRADTQGSLEAIQGILARESTEDVSVNVMFAGIGAPTEGDVLLASTANALILCFSVTPSGSVKKLAEQKKLEVKTFRIIYELIDEVKRLVKGTLEPVYEDRYLGRAEVRMVIRVPKAGGNIAGSYVLDGKITRGSKARVLRRNKEVARSTVSGLRRFKDDVREVQSGYECGINLANYDAFEEGDVIEVTETVEVGAAS
jgi:translation initiation factor IF-2